jgi:hypothetical protein
MSHIRLGLFNLAFSHIELPLSLFDILPNLLLRRATAFWKFEV